MIQPQTKAADLIERLGQLAQAQDANEFQLRIAEREAKAILQHDANQGYVILGIINAIRGDYNAAMDYHQKAIRISNDYWTNRQLLASLFNMKCWREAMAQADLLMEQFTPTPPDVPLIGMEAAVRAGSVQKARQYHASFTELVHDMDKDSKPSQIMNTIDILSRTGLTDIELGEMNLIAEQVAKDMGATIISTYTWENTWEDPYFVTNEYWVTGADTVDMVFELADRIAAINPHAFKKGGYHVTFRPAPTQKAE